MLAQEPRQRSFMRRLVRHSRQALAEWCECLAGFAPQLLQLFGRQACAHTREQLVVEDTELRDECGARWSTSAASGLPVCVHLEDGRCERRLHIRIVLRVATKKCQTIRYALEVSGKTRGPVGALGEVCECPGRD